MLVAMTETRELRRRVLVVTAKNWEAEAFARDLTPAAAGSLGPYPAWTTATGRWQVTLIAGGVGSAAAAAATATALCLEPGWDLVISGGVAGALRDRGLSKGDLVVGTEVVPVGFGVEGPDGFQPASQLGWLQVPIPPPEWIDRAVRRCRALPGPILCVNEMTGTDGAATRLVERFPGAVAEAMEGLGVATASLPVGVPMFELRAISNMVGVRDRNKTGWVREQALDTLSSALPALLD
jgi:futalosine hydrolase